MTNDFEKKRGDMLTGQTEEMIVAIKGVIERNCDLPVTFVGVDQLGENPKTYGRIVSPELIAEQENAYGHEGMIHGFAKMFVRTLVAILPIPKQVAVEVELLSNGGVFYNMLLPRE